MNSSTTAQTPAERFAARADRFAGVLDAASSRWDAPTPCEGWTAGDVVRHVIETERDFLTQRELPLAGTPDLTDPAGLAAAWAGHAAEVSEVLARDGVAEHAYDGYFGPTTIGAMLADFYGWDLTVHGWDVARAFGAPYPIDDAEAAELSASADGWGPALYSEGVCTAAVEVPADASAFERLLGRLGRDPHWSAPSR